MIYNEDCNFTMEHRLAQGSIDLVVTSPPYDGLRLYGGYSFDFERTAKNLQKILVMGGVIIWVVNDSVINGGESLISFKQAIFFQSLGLLVYDTMIFAKKNPMPCNARRFEQQFDYMFCISKGKPKTFNPIKVPCVNAGKPRNMAKQKVYEQTYSMKDGMGKDVYNTDKTATNIFYYNVGGGDKDKTTHNAPFPEKLVEDQMFTWSNKGDIIYDPFSGSGTTGKVAAITGRKFIGSETNGEWHAESEQRILNVF